MNRRIVQNHFPSPTSSKKRRVFFCDLSDAPAEARSILGAISPIRTFPVPKDKIQNRLAPSSLDPNCRDKKLQLLIIKENE